MTFFLNKNVPFLFFSLLQIFHTLYLNSILNNKNKEMMRLALNRILGWGKECTCFILERLPVKTVKMTYYAYNSHNGVLHLRKNGKYHHLTFWVSCRIYSFTFMHCVNSKSTVCTRTFLFFFIFSGIYFLEQFYVQSKIGWKVQSSHILPIPTHAKLPRPEWGFVTIDEPILTHYIFFFFKLCHATKHIWGDSQLRLW